MAFPDAALAWIQAWPWTKEGTRARLALFRRTVLRTRNDRHEQVCNKAKAHNRVLDLGVTLYRLADSRPADRAHPCTECKAVFLTKAAAAAHRAACHGVRSDAAFAVGTACEVCRRQFWGTKRLAQHFRSSPRCAAVYRDQSMAAFQAGTLLIGPAAAVREILAECWLHL